MYMMVSIKPMQYSWSVCAADSYC